MKSTFLRHRVFICFLGLALGLAYLYGCGEGNPDISSPEVISSEYAPDNQSNSEFLATNPDLVVEPPSVSDNGPTVGTKFTLSVTVRNEGDGASGVTALRYYRSTDTAISASDTEIGTDAVTGIGVSGSVGESVEVTAEPTPGTYYYGACVDAVEEESDTTNNCSTSVEINVPESQGQLQEQSQGYPDLTISAVSVATNPGGTYPGGFFTFSATVRNDGDGTSEATTLRYYQSTDSTISTSDTEIGTDALAGISASGSTSESVEVTAPSNPGTYYYGACVDSVTDESDTANNCSSSVQINVLELQNPPDLVVESPSVNDNAPEAEASFTLSATVRNSGQGDAPATTLRYYRSTDATITTSDTEVGMDTVSTLLPSATSAESISLTAPMTGGTYYYGACVDSVTDESDTTNNCSSSVEINVPEPQHQLQEQSQDYPDLVASLSLLSSSTPDAGTKLTLKIAVSNNGDGASEATTVRFYQSTDATITTSDTEVFTSTIPALFSPLGNTFGIIFRSLTAPETPGTYYYGVCVDSVTDESDTTNNCSASVMVDVQ